MLKRNFNRLTLHRLDRLNPLEKWVTISVVGDSAEIADRKFWQIGD